MPQGCQRIPARSRLGSLWSQPSRLPLSRMHKGGVRNTSFSGFQFGHQNQKHHPRLDSCVGTDQPVRAFGEVRLHRSHNLGRPAQPAVKRTGGRHRLARIDRGKRRTLLDINSDARYALGVLLDREVMKFVVANLSDELAGGTVMEGTGDEHPDVVVTGWRRPPQRSVSTGDQ